MPKDRILSRRKADPSKREIKPVYADIFDEDIPERERWYWSEKGGAGRKLFYPFAAAAIKMRLQMSEYGWTRRRSDPRRLLLPPRPYIDISDDDVPENEDWYWSEDYGGGRRLGYPTTYAREGTMLRELNAIDLEYLYKRYGARDTRFGTAIRKYYHGLHDYISSEKCWEDVYVPYGTTYNWDKMKQVQDMPWMMWCSSQAPLKSTLDMWLYPSRRPVFETIYDIEEVFVGPSPTWEEVEDEDYDSDYSRGEVDPGSEEEEEEISDDEDKAGEGYSRQIEEDEDSFNSWQYSDDKRDLPEDGLDDNGAEYWNMCSESAPDDTNSRDMPERGWAEGSNYGDDLDSDVESALGFSSPTPKCKLRQSTPYHELEFDGERTLPPPTPYDTPCTASRPLRYGRLQEGGDGAHRGSPSSSPCPVPRSGRRGQTFASTCQESALHTRLYTVSTTPRSPPTQFTTPKRKRSHRTPGPSPSESEEENPSPLKRLCKITTATIYPSPAPTPKKPKRTAKFRTRTAVSAIETAGDGVRRQDESFRISETETSATVGKRRPRPRAVDFD
ncbi:hypothetical protein V5O48_003086 [Marasmius crinis-equi]|uniref:Uncharacterized protein n=1 Tax=Marasmius crinis-equi TaxID=585013 RepID=A0ABR3FTX6_9AGAR